MPAAYSVEPRPIPVSFLEALSSLRRGDVQAACEKASKLVFRSKRSVTPPVDPDLLIAFLVIALASDQEPQPLERLGPVVNLRASFSSLLENWTVERSKTNGSEASHLSQATLAAAMEYAADGPHYQSTRGEESSSSLVSILLQQALDPRGELTQVEVVAKVEDVVGRVASLSESSPNPSQPTVEQQSPPRGRPQTPEPALRSQSPSPSPRS